MRKNVVVTGATGDIGRKIVGCALSQGKTVFATIRKDEQKNLFPAHENLHFVKMFVDEPESIQSGFEDIDRQVTERGIDAVIHCAAVESPTPIEFLSVEDYKQLFTVNTIGSLSILKEVMPRLRKSKGVIVFAGSLWGRLSAPMVGPYASSKWALEAIVDSARRETRGMDISIVMANIGAVQSTMLTSHLKTLESQIEQLPEASKSLYRKVYEKHIDTIKKVEPHSIVAEKVAVELLRIADINNPKPRYKIGLDAKLLCFLDAILPNSWMDKIFSL